jgi:hypothetical protein
MLFGERLVATVTFAASAEKLADAGKHARTMKSPGDRREQVFDHHRATGRPFDAILAATSTSDGRAAWDRPHLGLAGHAIAGESVRYSRPADPGGKSDAGPTCEKQATTKIQLAFFGKNEPICDTYLKPWFADSSRAPKASYGDAAKNIGLPADVRSSEVQALVVEAGTGAKEELGSDRQAASGRVHAVYE